MVSMVVGPTVSASGQGGQVIPVLSEVRIARHDTFDRVVFEFTGDTAPQATIDGPQANGPGVVTADPSGASVAVDGAQVLTIAMSRRMKTSSMAGFTSHAMAPSIVATTMPSRVPTSIVGQWGLR